uniref:Uncharacterized protein n=1 Tax=Cacopsylla melanoneura TaxID=428564 RepID=A0A8D8M579_9HEMI
MFLPQTKDPLVVVALRIPTNLTFPNPKKKTQECQPGLYRLYSESWWSSFINTFCEAFNKVVMKLAVVRDPNSRVGYWVLIFGLWIAPFIYQLVPQDVGQCRRYISVSGNIFAACLYPGFCMYSIKVIFTVFSSLLNTILQRFCHTSNVYLTSICSVYDTI